MSSESHVDYESGVFRWILIGGLVLMLIVGIAVCGFVAMFLARSSAPAGPNVAAEEKEAQAAIRKFMDDIKAGNAQAAYAKTSKRFQAQKSAAVFGNEVGQLGWLSGYKEKSLGTATMGENDRFGGQMVFTNAESESAKAEVDVVKENNVWKVDLFHAERTE